MLADERTGAVLASSRPGSGAALEDCAAAVEALASSLHRGAGIDAGAESAAVGDRAQAWMP